VITSLLFFTIMEKYFIIRANEWCLYWIKGTIKDLELFLKSLNINIKTYKSINYHDMHLIYNQKIITEVTALGYNSDLYEELKKEISTRLININREAYSWHKDKLEDTLHAVCDHVPVKSNRIDILVSDGKEYELPPNHFCGRRTFIKFSDVDLAEFKRRVRDVGYIELC